MRDRSVRSRRDGNLERDAFGPRLQVARRNPAGNLAVGAVDEALLGELREDSVRNLSRPADGRELTVVLDGAQGFDQSTCRHELEPTALERLEAVIGHIGRLEADPAREELRQMRPHVAPRLHELHALHLSRSVGVTKIGVEHRALRFDEERGIGALETREVAEVDLTRDEERLLEPAAEALDPSAHVVPARNSSASR